MSDPSTARARWRTFDLRPGPADEAASVLEELPVARVTGWVGGASVSGSGFWAHASAVVTSAHLVSRWELDGLFVGSAVEVEGQWASRLVVPEDWVLQTDDAPFADVAVLWLPTQSSAEILTCSPLTEREGPLRATLWAAGTSLNARDVNAQRRGPWCEYGAENLPGFSGAPVVEGASLGAGRVLGVHRGYDAARAVGQAVPLSARELTAALLALGFSHS